MKKLSLLTNALLLLGSLMLLCMHTLSAAGRGKASDVPDFITVSSTPKSWVN